MEELPQQASRPEVTGRERQLKLGDVIAERRNRATHARLLLQALRQVGAIFLMGFVLGLTLITIHHFLEKYHTEELGKVHPLLANLVQFDFVLEAIGIGLIVSSIAVVLYEWGSHVKGALELTETLLAAIVSTEEATQRLMEAQQIQEMIHKQEASLSTSLAGC